MITFEDISVRLMQDCSEDYSIVSKWLSDPAVLEYYEGRDNPFDFDRVVAKFKPRVLKQDNVVACIIQYRNIDVGYIQYYELTSIDKKEYGYSESEKVFGIDLFIGETKYWNSGIGSKVIKAIIRFMENDKGADKIVIDPQTWNTRAVKCYEKCGFAKVKLLPKHELHEGDYKDKWLMEIKL